MQFFMSEDESPKLKKIEERMLNAIKQQTDLNLKNTKVEIIDFPGIPKRVNVYLYSKCICKLSDDELEVNHHGFMTNTTKSRINALLREFNGSTELVQVNGTWYWKTLSMLSDASLYQWQQIPSHSKSFIFKRTNHVCT